MSNPIATAREEARLLLRRFGYFQPEMTDAFTAALVKRDAEITRLRAENDRIRGCLIVMSAAEVGGGSFRTAAYDVALNCVDADTLRTRFAR